MRPSPLLAAVLSLAVGVAGLAALARPACAQSTALKARDLMAQGETARKRGDEDQAMEYYRLALDAQPGLSEASDALGRVLLRRKRWEEAATVFAAAVERNPNYHKGYYRLGYALRKGGKTEDAAAAYEQYVQVRPHDPDGYYGLGSAYEQMGDKELAVAAYSKYVRLEKRPSEQKWVGKARATIAALGGTPPVDEHDLTSPIAAAPAAAPAVPAPPPPGLAKAAPAPAPEAARTTSGGVRRGDEAFQGGDYGTAIAAYRGAVRDDGKDAEARYKLAVALIVKGDLADADRALVDLLKVDPAFDGGRRLLDRVRLRRAENEGRDPLDPTGDPGALLDQAGELLDAQDYALALRLLRRARAGGADAPLCDRMEGQALAALGEFDAAADAYTRALGHGVEGLRAHRGIASVYEQLGDLERAAYHLTLFLQLAPDEPSMGALEEADAERMLRSVEARLGTP